MILIALPLALLAAQVAGAAPGDAGDALRPRYLTPDQYRAATGTALSLQVQPADAAPNAKAAWPAGEIRWFFMRGLGTQENRDTIEPSQPGGDHAEVRLGGAGVTMLGIDFKPTVATVDRAAWKEYADKHVSEAGRKAVALDKSKQSVRVRHVASAKALVRVEGDAEPSTVATGKSGQKVEIRPLADPTTMLVGGDLPLRLYVDGDKCSEARVRATHIGSGVVREISGNAGGFANLTIDDAGTWRIEFQHITKAEPGDEFDMTLWSASATFEVPVKQERR